MKRPEFLETAIVLGGDSYTIRANPEQFKSRVLKHVTDPPDELWSSLNLYLLSKHDRFSIPNIFRYCSGAVINGETVLLFPDNIIDKIKGLDKIPYPEIKVAAVKQALDQVLKHEQEHIIQALTTKSDNGREHSRTFLTLKLAKIFESSVIVGSIVPIPLLVSSSVIHQPILTDLAIAFYGGALLSAGGLYFTKHVVWGKDPKELGPIQSSRSSFYDHNSPLEVTLDRP